MLDINSHQINMKYDRNLANKFIGYAVLDRR